MNAGKASTPTVRPKASGKEDVSWMFTFYQQGSFYLAMIRKPTTHFESVFNGYQIDTLLGTNNTSDPFDEFLSKPRQHLLNYLKKEPRFDINLNMAKNGKRHKSAVSTSSFAYWSGWTWKSVLRPGSIYTRLQSLGTIRLRVSRKCRPAVYNSEFSLYTKKLMRSIRHRQFTRFF